MLSEKIKIGNKVIGKAFIETDREGIHTEIEVWISNTLLQIALDSNCNNITVTKE